MIRLTLAALLLALHVLSCSFAPPPVGRAFEESSVVAIVTVTEMLEIRPGIGNKAKARVDQSWKGPAPGTVIEVQDSRYCTIISLKKGMRILLYSGPFQTWTPGQPLSVHFTRSMPIEWATVDLQYFTRLREAAAMPRYLQGTYLFLASSWDQLRR